MTLSKLLFLFNRQEKVLIHHPDENEWQFIVQEEGELEAFFLPINQNLKVSVVLNGEKAKSDIKCAYLLNDNNNLKLDIQVLHKVKNTASNQQIKGLATGKSSIVLTAGIKIPQNTNRCEGCQNHRAIVLSDTAKISATPQLEIWSDDVVCSHGSAVGPLPEESIYYLQTRGLKKSEAEKLLLSSFFNDIVPDEFNTYIEEWMEQNV